VRTSDLRTSRDERRRLTQKIVRRLRASEGNVGRVSRELGVSRKLVTRLRDLHRIERGQSKPERRTGNRHRERAKVERALETTGGNVKEVVRSTGIAETTVRRWRAERHPVWQTVEAAAFFASTREDKESGCLIWEGNADPSGYGRTSLGGRLQAAHRVAYQLKHRYTLSPSVHLHHVCRNKRCVNPTHLLPVDPAGEHGHATIHRLEDAAIQAIASGVPPEDNSPAWPAWMDERAIGSLRASDVATEEAAAA
jgi:hypothetical protein